MFVGSNPKFYFATIRKVTTAFGSLFNNLYITRFEQPGGKGQEFRRIKVPLEYSKGRRWFVKRIRDIASGKGVQTKTSFPRVAFEMTNIQYDPNRQLPPSKSCPKQSLTTGNILTQLNPVPYDIAYDVYIATNNIDDGLQLIEQILPYFRPSYNLTVKDIPELQIKKDIPIIFSGISMQDETEGSFLDSQGPNIWTLSFVVKGYIYPPIADDEDNLIRKVISNIYNDVEMEEKNQVIVTKVNPIDAMINDEWTDETHIFNSEQLDSNGDPITDSNGDPL